MHLTNWDNGTLEDVLVNGSTGTIKPGSIATIANNSTAYGTNDGYSSSGGIVLDYYGPINPEPAADVPGKYFGSDITVYGSATIGLFMGGITQVFFTNVQILSSGGDGVYILESGTIQLSNLTSKGGSGNGISFVDVGNNVVNLNSVIGVLFASNAGADIFAYGTKSGSTGNVVSGGIALSARTTDVMNVGTDVPIVKVVGVNGVNDLGFQTAAASAPGVGTSGTYVSNPFASSGGVTLTGGTGTAVSVKNAAGTVIQAYTQASGSFSSAPQFFVPYGVSISVTYTVAPTWTWKGELGVPAIGGSGSTKKVYNTFPYRINVYVNGGTGVTTITKGIGSNSANVLSQAAGAVVFATFSLNPGEFVYYTWSSGGAPTQSWEATL
jgi:hypothetical protein